MAKIDSDCKHVPNPHEITFTVNDNKQTCRCLICGEWFEEDVTLPGYIKCECGAETLYGKGTNLHSKTMPCPRYKDPNK